MLLNGDGTTGMMLVRALFKAASSMPAHHNVVSQLPGSICDTHLS
jgi:hypothetical protein